MCDNNKPPKTFFWYFRPIALLARLMGVFPVGNILTSDSKNLTIRIKSVPYLYSCFIFVATIYMIWQFFGFMFVSSSIFLSIVIYTMLVRSIICFLFCCNYSKKLPKLIQLLDMFDRKKNYKIFENKSNSICKNLILWTILPILFGIASLLLSLYESSNVMFEITSPYSTERNYTKITPWIFGALSIWQIEPFLLYIYFSVKIRCNFEELNRTFKRNGCIGRFSSDNNDIVKYDQECLYKTLEHIRYMHNMMSKSVMELSKCYGTFMALDQLCMITMIVINIGAFIYDKDHEMHLLAITIINTVVVLSAVYISHKIKEAGNKIVSLLFGVMLSDLNTACQSQIRMFMLQMSAQPIEVSAGGFFVVDKTQIPTMLSSVATYLIVLVQFIQSVGVYTNMDPRAFNADSAF